MKKALSVKQLNSYLKSELQTNPFLRNLLIEGEVINLSINKYTYFSLKDDNETISCVYFGNDKEIAEGEKIQVIGDLTLYARDSKYQIRIKEIQKIGQGQYSLELLHLINKLNKKGYFLDEYKKEIPKYSQNIGLITGNESAAYYDFIKVFNDNKYPAKIYFYPSLVQGKTSANQMITAVSYLDSLELDLIVITRGGGSKEDLAAFNDEGLAQAIFNAKTPIISAIGHEIDQSITDLVSDLRLQTPTKAAEFVVKNHNLAILELNNYKLLIEDSLRIAIENRKTAINLLTKDIEINKPTNKLDKIIWQVDQSKNLIFHNVNHKLSKSIEEINAVYKSIETIYREKLSDMQFFVKSLDGKIKQANDLNVGARYVLTNEKSSYRIYIEEDLDE